MFNKEFISKQYINSLKADLMRAMQYEGESVTQFVDRMSALFNGLPHETEEGEMVDTIIEKMVPDIAMTIIDKEFVSVSQLRATALKIDSVRQRAETNQRSKYVSQAGISDGSRNAFPSPSRRGNRDIGVLASFPAGHSGASGRTHLQAHENFSPAYGQNNQIGPRDRNAFQLQGITSQAHPQGPYSVSYDQRRNARQRRNEAICFGCKNRGHIRRFCPLNNTASGNEIQVTATRDALARGSVDC